MKELIFELRKAWRTRTIEFPMGIAWFRVVRRGVVEPVSGEGWIAFYVLITFIIGGTYYLFTGRDPLGLNLDLPFLALASLALFIACTAICILKTDFNRRR